MHAPGIQLWYLRAWDWDTQSDSQSKRLRVHNLIAVGRSGSMTFIRHREMRLFFKILPSIQNDAVAVYMLLTHQLRPKILWPAKKFSGGFR